MSQEFGGDPVRHLFTALSNAGLIVEEVDGANFLIYLKVKELSLKRSPGAYSVSPFRAKI